MNDQKNFIAQSAIPLPSGFPSPTPAAAGGLAGVGAGAGVFAAWESHVAARLGLSRKKISDIRREHLEPEVDFTKRGNAVVFTARGLARVEALIAATPQGDSTPMGAKTTTGGDLAGNAAGSAAVNAAQYQPERARFVVVRVLPNRNLLFARRADYAPSAPETLLRVKDNRNFHPRLAAFEAQRGADGMWRYLGRLPRSLGRW